MKTLKESLEQLQNELKNAKEIDAESVEILRKLMNDIHEVLRKSHQNEEIAEEHGNIIEELKKSAQNFELSHPELAGAIRIVINSFSNIGA